MKEVINENQNTIFCDGSVLSSVHMHFSIIYRHGRVMHDKAMKEFGISGQQMGYLKYVNEKPGLSQEDLAKYLQIDKGAVAKSIKDLVSKGLIERKQNPYDKRAYCLFPTEKAARIDRRGKALYAELERHLTKGMTDEEVKNLIALLDKVTGNIMQMMEGGNL